MSDVTMTTSAEPDGAPRIAALDILRGLAILGILFMNINDMGQSIYASFADFRHLGWSASDQVAWWLREVLANGTARCMLEMLFGAGMVILTDRAAEKAGGWAVMRRYYGRNLILFAFGLIHIFILLWPGDILHTYGLAALVAFLFRRLRAKWLIPIGLLLALVEIAGGGATYGISAYNKAVYPAAIARQQAHQRLSRTDKAIIKAHDQAVKERAKSKAEAVERITAEDKARSAAGGTFTTWATMQWHSIIELERTGVEILFVWEAASVMLIGAALFKLGILQGQRTRRFYAWMTAISYALGVVLRILGGLAQTDLPGSGPHLAPAFYELAREAMTLGHVGAINLLAGTVFGARLLRPFVAAGRTALTIYIAQTMICLWVLYPPFVLGLYGTMTWGPLMLTALIVNAALLVGANVWVRWFDIAPVEWAWRSLVARRVLPWRRPRRDGVVLAAGDPLVA